MNSFDLVRIHRFRDKDVNADQDTRVNDLPSYKAMCDLAAEDDAVREELNKENLERIRGYFDDGFVDTDPEGEWMKQLSRDKKGNIDPTPDNLIIILENDPNLCGRVAYNDFSFRLAVLKDLPWRKKEQGNVWNDTDDACLRNYLSKVYEIQGANKIADACSEVFMRHHFHPVRDYIKSLKWDGVKRAETLWIDYLGAEDTHYTREVTRKHLAAAVARVFEPGCKFDYVIILSGQQGIGKSTMLKKLGREWFSDSLSAVQGKEAYEQLHGVWIAEMGELYATRKSESEAVKLFLSKQEDIFRVAYGRRTSTFPRQCVFYGTTNDSQFLRDWTGNRRFWPLAVRQPVPAGLDREPPVLAAGRDREGRENLRGLQRRDRRAGLGRSVPAVQGRGKTVPGSGDGKRGPGRTGRAQHTVREAGTDRRVPGHEAALAVGCHDPAGTQRLPEG